MTWQTREQFGTCPCGGRYAPRTVEVDLTTAAGRVTLTDTPQGQCPDCGSRVYKQVELGLIEAIHHGRPVPPLG